MGNSRTQRTPCTAPVHTCGQVENGRMRNALTHHMHRQESAGGPPRKPALAPAPAMTLNHGRNRSRSPKETTSHASTRRGPRRQPVLRVGHRSREPFARRKAMKNLKLLLLSALEQVVGRSGRLELRAQAAGAAAAFFGGAFLPVPVLPFAGSSGQPFLVLEPVPSSRVRRRTRSSFVV